MGDTGSERSYKLTYALCQHLVRYLPLDEQNRAAERSAHLLWLSVKDFQRHIDGCDAPRLAVSAYRHGAVGSGL